MNAFKQQIIAACNTYLSQKINSLQGMLHDVEEATNSETKSTAGDKHETGRAMMQLEREKLGQQLLEAETQFSDFQKIDFNKPFPSASQGCLLQTNKGWFLIASAIGKIMVEEQTIFVISPASPLGKCFSGIKQKGTVMFNGASYNILSIT